MQHRIRTLVASLSLLVLSAVVAPTTASAAGGALDAFRAGHARVAELVAKHAATAAIQREVDALLDYSALAQESLGGAAHYAERCGTRCDEFDALLGRLIRENYLRRLRSDRAHSVDYLGEELRPRGTQVMTTVLFSSKKDGKDERVAVEYLMHRVAGRWQVRDIITDGVSLARNYKYEFNQILKRDGIDGLIARLESKLAVLARND